MSDPFITTPSSAQVPPAEYWRREVAAITADAQRILKRVDEANRIARANRIPALVAATPDGEAVPGTNITRQQAEAWIAMVNAVAEFLNQEIAPDFTISDGLYALWPVVVPEEPAV
jgi:hypothetical protein